MGWSSEWENWARLAAEWPKVEAVSLREITEYKPTDGPSLTKEDLAGGPVFVQTLNTDGITETHNPDGWGAKPWLKPKITELKSQGFNDPAITDAIRKLVNNNFDTSKFKSQGSNLVDDQAYLYFQCEGCETILDPHTKSFQTLQEYRVNAGWKCIWNIDGMGYKVYCEKCGEKV